MAQKKSIIRFGTHCSLRKGLTGALEEAHALGCESLQMFTRSPRMWRMRMPTDDEIDEFVQLRAEYNLFPLMVHTPYLPNLATAKKDLLALSRKALHDDLQVAERLMADYLVIHPGSYSDGATHAKGMQTIIDSFNRVLDKIPGKTKLLYENVAGGGRRIGSTFEELAELIEGVNDKSRTGVCFDTAHALGAGYDISTPKGVDDTLTKFNSIIGKKYLYALHLNDSQVPLGSHKDRHEHLGKGYVGKKGFAQLIKRVTPYAKMGILETPKDPPEADKRNLSYLFSLRS